MKKWKTSKLNRQVTKVSKYEFKPEDKLLLDANIWISVYGPSEPGNDKAKIYSRALDNMMRARSQIFVDVLIVSEFINSYARKMWYIAKEGEPELFKKFKAYRQSEDFKEVAEEISVMASRIVTCCKRIGNDFETMEIDTLMQGFAEGQSDFNDQVIVEICKRRELKLVTDDRDFENSDIAILTANRGLLSRSQ